MFIFLAKGKMRTYTIDDVVLFCNEDIAREYENDKDISEFNPEIYINECLENFINKNPKIKELSELHSELKNLKGKAILSAHSGCRYNYDKKSGGSG